MGMREMSLPQSACADSSLVRGSLVGKVFCFTCGNDEARVVATKGEHNLVECTTCGCRWRRSLDPLYERTALLEVDVGEQIATSAAPPRNDSGDKVPLGCNDSGGTGCDAREEILFERRNAIY